MKNDAPPLPRRAYTVKAAARLLSLSERTLRSMIAEEKIRAPLVSKRRRVVPDSELRRILEGN